ncbi:MAG: PhzF family phenazine biosynthesis protein [Chloroflexi bacterium]|nr:PhzF family phenazine biosynthesis protein [Chloroflexota bacterium]
MPTYRFKQVDVFTGRPFFGNPVAVVLDADDIDPAQMQRIASWTNLSETTFVLKPTADADYRLRIFTPGQELPFAGHPTVGSAHAVLESGILPSESRSIRQECLAGVLPLTMESTGEDRRIFVRVPEAKVVGTHEASADAISAALGAPIARRPAPMAIDVGAIWLVALMEDVESLRRLEPDMAAVAKLSHDLSVVGVTVFGLESGDGAAVHVRSFAPAEGILEDPVCGSGNATVAAYLSKTGMLKDIGDEYVASQGTEMGRDGKVFVRVFNDGRGIEIGGHAVTVIEGEIRL